MPRTRKSRPPRLKARVAVEAIKAHRTRPDHANVWRPPNAGGGRNRCSYGMSNNREEGNPPEDGGAYSKNGTRPNPQAAVRWGAQSERAKLPGASDGECEMSAEWGKSTGPPTAEGLERCRMRNWRHGKYSKEAPAATRLVRALLREGAGLIAKMKAMSPLYIGPPTASDGFPRLGPRVQYRKKPREGRPELRYTSTPTHFKLAEKVVRRWVQWERKRAINARFLR